MRKLLKYMGLCAVASIALLVAAVAVLGSIDVNKYKPLLIDTAASMTGRDVQITGDLELELSLTPRIAVADVRLGNTAWGSRPDMVTVRRFAAKVALLPLLFGDIDVQELELAGVDVLLETDSTGAGNWHLSAVSEQPSTDTGAASIPVIRDVVLQDIRVIYRDGASGTEQQLAIDRLIANADGNDVPINLDVQGHLDAEAFRAEGTVGSIQALTADSPSFPVDITAKMFDASVSFAGNVNLSPNGAIDINGKGSVDAPEPLVSVSKIARVTAGEGAVPQFPDIEALSLSTDIEFSGETLGMTGISLTTGNTDIAGNATVVLTERPRIDASFVSNSIDLNAFIPKTANTGTERTETDGRLFPDDPLPLEAFRHADVEMKVDVKKLLVQIYEIQDVALQLSLEDGRLDVSPISLQLAGGRIAGHLRAVTSGSNLSVDTELQISNLDYGTLLEMQGASKLVAGLANGEIAASGSGASIRSIMASLNGNSFITTENAEIDSAALGIVSADILSALPGLSGGNAKLLRCGVVNLDIQDGIATTRAVVFETGALAAIGVGGASLKDETLNLVIDPRVKQASLASAAVVPVTVGGTFLQPKWSLDAAALATGAAGTVAKGAAAFATMGLSLLAESIAKRAVGAVDKTDYCTPALAGNIVKPTAASESTDEGGNAPTPPSQGGNSGIVDGVSKGLRSLFGN